jgi:hypothetical protein
MVILYIQYHNLNWRKQPIHSYDLERQTKKAT